jgi:putative hydrolase of the HAD superfamily
MIKHIFFDLDNTLWDFDKNSESAIAKMYAFYKIKEMYGVDFSVFHKNYYQINENLWLQFRDNHISKEELRQRRFKEAFICVGIENINLAEKFEEIYFEEIVKFNFLIEGAEELLRELSKRYKIHILSNGFYEVTKRKIETSAIKKYITTWTSSEEINIRKPRPEIFEFTLHKAQAKKEESIYIGDDLIADIEGGTNFGIKTIYFNRKKNDIKELIDSVDSLLELKKILSFKNF